MSRRGITGARTVGAKWFARNRVQACMENSRRASIIIVAHNGEEYLGQCLASVRQEAGPGDELIVVDNASSDGSAALVQREWPEARLIKSTRNLGFGAASNIGAQHAKGYYLVFLNQDTVVLSGWLEGLLAVLESEDREALVTSNQLFMAQPELVHSTGADLHYSGLIFLRGLLRPAKDAARTVQRVHSIVGASFAVRRDIWGELGGFDPVFFMYYEEMDLSWRAQLAGYACFYAPDSVVHHDVPLTGASYSKLYHVCRNRHISLIKNWRLRTLALLGPGLALADLAEFGYVILASGLTGVRAKLLAYAWLVRNLAQIMRLRRRSQSLRRVPDWLVLENRMWALDPRQFTGGGIGRVLARLASMPLCANGWIAWRICRVFGW